jgi:hypothetical protein
MTYALGNCLQLESYRHYGDANYGNQHVCGITFDGRLSGKNGIAVNFRSNVEIYDCAFKDFVRTAVYFYGQPSGDMTIDNPYETRTTSNEDSRYLPDNDGFCTGNKFYNNIITNCCGRISGNSFSGAVQWGTQDGWLCYGNDINCTGRADRDNGVAIKFHDVGFNKNTKIHDNTFNVGRMAQNYWQFAIEVWWDLGGTEIYNNVSQGSFDLCDSWDQYGAGYGIKCYDNNIGYSALGTGLDRGILFEGTHVSNYIYRNYIHHVSRAFTGNNYNYSTTRTYDGLYIFDNICVELGQSGTAYQSWGFQWDTEITSGTLHQNIFIQNNIFHASSSAASPTMYGIMIPTVGQLDNFHVENNIFIHWERGAIFGIGARTQASNILLRNNLIFDCYKNNEDVTLNANFTPTNGITFSGTVKANPEFVSSTDWHLSSSSSPAYHVGIFVGLTTDYAGTSWNNPPSIGAYECVTSSGIRLIPHQTAMKVYPNPVSDELTIEIEGNIDRTAFEILNSLGQSVLKGNPSGKTTIYLTGFSPGVYFIKVANRKFVEVEKIIKL